MQERPRLHSLQVLAKINNLSQLVNRAQLLSRLGQQYNDARDMYQALGYKLEPDYDDFLARYKRQDVGTAIIDRFVHATWRGGITVLDSSDAEDTAFEEGWKDLYKELKLLNKFVRLDILTCLGQYGVLLLGLDDVKNQQDFSKPVTPGKRELLYIKPLGEDSSEVNKWEQNAGNPRYGLPVLYNVKITNPDGDTNKQILVHHTRVLHIAQGLLESETLGTPVLENVYNRLYDLEKVVGGSAEMFWRGARPGYQGIVDKEAQEVDTSGLQDQFDEFEHNLRRYMINKGVEMKALQQQVSSPKTQAEVALQMIAAAKGIPLRILLGSERGELASSQDRSNWFDKIQSRRENYAELVIVKPFIDKCIEYQILPTPKDSYSVQWMDLYAMSDGDKANVGKTRAEALRAYSAEPLSQEILPIDTFYRLFLGLPSEEIELIEEQKKEMIIREEEEFEVEEE